MTGTDLIIAARELVGTPYRHQGRNEFGVDCIGLLILALTRAGVLPADFERSNYGRLPGSELLDKTAIYCEPLHRPEPGCMALIRWPGDRAPGHAAFVTGRNLIHAHRHAGRVIEHRYGEPWQSWTHGWHWFRGVDHG